MYYDERENKIKNEIKDIENYYKNENKEINSYEENDIKSWDTDMLLNIDNININNFRKNDNSLFSESEGFNKGNSFKSIYKPYKNYVYKVVVKGKKDELLLKIQELSFRVIDLGLYLDVNPSDSMIYNEFRGSVRELKKYKDMYEKTYGPLELCETEYYDSYKWSESPWPWVNEGGKF